jgi:hypothetical protein
MGMNKIDFQHDSRQKSFTPIKDAAKYMLLPPLISRFVEPQE